MQLEGTAADTTTLSYWLTWRVLLCAIWVFVPMVIALLMIWKYDGKDHSKSDRRDTQQDISEDFCGDEVWRPCLKEIHPVWLLIYRVISFSLLLATLIIKVAIAGSRIFYFYTQWTFTLVTIYFGFGSLLSIYGCFWCKKTSSTTTLGDYDHVGTDAENGTYIPLENEEKDSSPQDESCLPRAAAKCSRVFEAMFEMNAGAVMLTDCIYWLVIFPFFTIIDYKMSFVLLDGVDAHSLLRYLCSNREVKTLPLVKMVSPLLSMLRTRYGVAGKTDDDFPGNEKLTSGDLKNQPIVKKTQAHMHPNRNTKIPTEIIQIQVECTLRSEIV
ncbi:hypothetical protein C1H46_016340 [Malus baccata]|uniref:Uncharacterized protein n=1 Tax=Malus baccata TaxID=106549 RepID=A0A540MH47_MALBA|nr:hypothetical protein C1H46_016340 [Malus baccata]